MFIGVERVVISCEIDALRAIDRSAVCDQLVRKAQSFTDLPVSRAKPVDLDPTQLARRSNQLLLRISGRATDVERGRKALSLAVTALRPSREGLRLPPEQPSTAMLVNVRGRWVLQGRIAAFEKLLGTSRTKSVRKPIVSDD